ncbi:nickel/cobalt transporter [Roseiarcaceae bacterium H3SJ34-1]|uniref:nickel/cobalt transporter n=1 Tax=Terripilifer ovatus TaxID=3032367 RepID=UPI003AB98FF1|nr:nickel/cobalt transporter [Roseiarcaceae bacterium H3SJ34-1]
MKHSTTSASKTSASAHLLRNAVFIALAAILCVAVVSVASAHDVFAQAPRNPFNVGISEGGGQATGITGWILAKQIYFERMLSGAVRAIKTDRSALWTLVGLSFTYGVFHAAGPGHGKAVVASYMLANERALQRGIAIAFVAAILQGLVAVALVSVLALLLNVTSQRMRDVANLVEVASYAGIAVLGAWLVWRKGAALMAMLRQHPPDVGPAPTLAGAAHGVDVHVHGHHDHDHAQHDHALARSHHDHHGHDHRTHDHQNHDHHAHGVPVATVDPHHVHDEHCGHFHAPDPSTLGDNFSWGSALATVLAAGSRPCSGAILVLVFALAQGLFLAGIAATFAMSIGTALTTGALAATAVFAKDIALKMAGGDSVRSVLLVRMLEFGAACLVLLIGASLFLGASAGGA